MRLFAVGSEADTAVVRFTQEKKIQRNSLVICTKCSQKGVC